MSRAGGPGRVAALTLVVVASAIAAYFDRETRAGFNQDWPGFIANRWHPTIRPLVVPTLRLGGDLMAGLVVLTLGLGLAALRGPFVMPGRRWPGRGRAAIAASSLALAISSARTAIEAMTGPTWPMTGPSRAQFLSATLQNCVGYPSNAVLGAWSLLLLAGRWRSRPVDGLERLGRLLGWGWLASIALELFRSALW